MLQEPAIDGALRTECAKSRRSGPGCSPMLLESRRRGRAPVPASPSRDALVSDRRCPEIRLRRDQSASVREPQHLWPPIAAALLPTAQGHAA